MGAAARRQPVLDAERAGAGDRVSQTTRSRVSTPAAQTTLDALSATFAMNAGNPSRAKQIADEVLASPAADDTAIGWAAAAAALSSARMGRFDEVDALAERAIAAGHPGLLRFTSGFGQTTALLMAGELDGAQALGQQLTDFAQMQQPGRAIGEVLVADVLIAKGELESAVSLLKGAAAALAPTGYSWGPLAWMLLAQALGQLGETVEAGKILSRAESRHGLKSMLFAPELALARAWTMSARRDTHGAVAAARDGAKAAERGGQSAVALRALHDAARLGDIRAADGIARLGAEIDCPFGQLALDHARAVVARDAASLNDVSARLGALGIEALRRRCRGAGAGVTARSKTAAEDLRWPHLRLVADDGAERCRMSVLDAFLSTWSNARATFGGGTPQTGAAAGTTRQADRASPRHALEARQRPTTSGTGSGSKRPRPLPQREQRTRSCT